MNWPRRFLIGGALALAILLTGRIALIGSQPAFGLSALFLSLPIVWLILRHPTFALQSGFLLVLIAGTKFRVRDPLASVESQADAQVFFELAVYAVLGILSMLGSLHMPRARLRITGNELLLLAYAGLVVLSAVWSPTTTFTFIRGVQIGVLLLYAFVTVRVFGPEKTWTLLANSVLAFSVLFAIIGLIMGGAGLISFSEGRFRWFYTHPIQVGSLAALGCIALISEFFFRGRSFTLPVRSVRVASLVFLLVVLLMTQSRGPLLALLTVFAALTMIKTLRATAAALGTVLVSSVALVLLNLPAGLVGILDSLASSGIPAIELLFRGQDVQEFLTMTGRMELWAEMIPAFVERPLFGHGYQVARIIGLEVAPWAGEAHNAIVQSLIDVGLIGTLLLIVPMFSTLIADYRLLSGPTVRQSRGAALVAGQFGMLLFVLVNSVGTAGFAGVPGFEPLLLFTAITIRARSSI